MSRYMSVVWIIQFFALLALSLVLLTCPRVVPELLDSCTPGDDDYGNERLYKLSAPREECTAGGPIAAPGASSLKTPEPNDRSAWREVRFVLASSQLLAPFTLLLAIFSLRAFMREDPRARRRLAIIFTITGCILTYLMILPPEGGGWFPSIALPLVLALLPMFLDKDLPVSGLFWQVLVIAVCILGWVVVSSCENVTLTEDTSRTALPRCISQCMKNDIPDSKEAQDGCVERCFATSAETIDRQANSADGLLTILKERPMLKIFCLLFWALVASNLLLVFWPLPQSAQRLSGSADTLPSGLWILWLFQGLFFMATAFVLSSSQAARWILSSSYFAPLNMTQFQYPGVLNDIQQLMPPLFLGAGLFSYAGMTTSREWEWRAVSWIFVIFYVAWILTFFYVWDRRFNSIALLFLGIMVLLGLLNLMACMRRGRWFVEEVGEGPDGWILVDLLVGPLLLLRTLLTRRRALYSRGAAARGFFQVADRSSAPHLAELLKHDFFPCGSRFEAQIRFSTEGADEAALATRGAALRLQPKGQGSFELLLGTGAYSPAENIVQFALLFFMGRLGGFVEAEFLKRHPRIREGLIAALRRAPDSYTRLHYYSQTVRFWITQDRTRHLVRYRLVPDALDFTHQSGLPEPEPHLGLALARRRLPDELRPTDYLRQELKRRLEGRSSARRPGERSCILRLEAQFHKPQPGDGNHWFNPAMDWRTDNHPWLILGRLKLEEIIPDEQAELLCFNPANVPPSLGTPSSAGPFDPRSIADSEKRVHRRIQSSRQFMAKVWGVPSSNPAPLKPT